VQGRGKLSLLAGRFIFFHLNILNSLSNGDALDDDEKVLGATGGAGGAVTLPIKNGKRALTKISQDGISNRSS
jgi:hypothetical protein